MSTPPNESQRTWISTCRAGEITFSTYSVPSEKAASASDEARAYASSSSASEVTSRMPRPPPPAAAFSSTGKPSSAAAARASATLVAAPSVPGTSGTPAARISAFACVLSPIRAITSAGGPMKTRSLSSQAWTNSSFSERKP